MMTRCVALLGILVFVFGVTAVYAQGETEEKITFDFRDADIKMIMRVLKEKAGIQYVIDPDVNKQVTVSLRDQTVDAAIKTILRAADLAYVYDEATSVYHIKSKPKAAGGARPTPAARRT